MLNRAGLFIYCVFIDWLNKTVNLAQTFRFVHLVWSGGLQQVDFRFPQLLQKLTTNNGGLKGTVQTL